jgi:hypothetical protein
MTYWGNSDPIEPPAPQWFLWAAPHYPDMDWEEDPRWSMEYDVFRALGAALGWRQYRRTSPAVTWWQRFRRRFSW